MNNIRRPPASKYSKGRERPTDLLIFILPTCTWNSGKPLIPIWVPIHIKKLLKALR